MRRPAGSGRLARLLVCCRRGCGDHAAVGPGSTAAGVALRLVVRGRTAGAVADAEARVPAARRAAIWLQIAISFALLVSNRGACAEFSNAGRNRSVLHKNQVLLVWTQDPEPEVREEIVARLRGVFGVQRVAYALRYPSASPREASQSRPFCRVTPGTARSDRIN